jgi:hypothetical protein
MKYAKILGLMAVAVTALMAFAASASATTLTSPTGTTYTGTITATSTNSSLDGAFTTVKCTGSHVEGTVESHGSGVTVKGNIKTLSFTGCNFPVTVKTAGSLELHAVQGSPHETCSTGVDTCTGTLTSSGAKVEIATSVGTCVFTTNNTSVGSITSTAQTGGNGVLDISGTIPRTEGNFLCGSSGTWTGSYTINTPERVWIDE